MFGEMGRLLRLASDMKTKMPQLQAKLEASEFAADSGGGTVQAVVNGKGRLCDLRIDGRAFTGGELGPAALADLADLVKSAVSAAQDKAAQAVAKAMRELTGGMSLPGMEGLIP